jgi:hypothetical protein
MKILFYTAILAFCCVGTAYGQVPFTVTPDSLWVSGPVTTSDVEAESIVHNTSGSGINLKWERININMPAGMHTMICDPNNCWFQTVSSKTFTLNAGQSGSMIVHFINEDSLPHDAIVHIKYTNTNNANQSITGIYVYHSETTGTHEQLPAPTVKLFPNPVVESFTLEHADAVSYIQVFSIDGREVANFQAVPGHNYSLNGQAAGTYIIGLQNKDGRTFQAIELVKN